MSHEKPSLSVVPSPGDLEEHDVLFTLPKDGTPMMRMPGIGYRLGRRHYEVVASRELVARTIMYGDDPRRSDIGERFERLHSAFRRAAQEFGAGRKLWQGLRFQVEGESIDGVTRMVAVVCLPIPDPDGVATLAWVLPTELAEPMTEEEVISGACDCPACIAKRGR